MTQNTVENKSIRQRVK